MKSLSDLQEQLEACTTFVKQLTGMLTGTTRGPYTKKANGAALRAQVHEAWQEHKQQQKRRRVVIVEPDPKRLTIPDAAKVLNMSEAGVRYQINIGALPAVKEMRTTKTSGPGAFPHAMIVIDPGDVQAMAAERNGGPQNGRTGKTITRQMVDQAIGKAKKAKPSSKAQRQLTADLLATLDRTEPRRLPNPHQVGVLVQHGYIKSKGDGVVLTGKVFKV